jgi:hypothetical protein
MPEREAKDELEPERPSLILVGMDCKVLLKTSCFSATALALPTYPVDDDHAHPPRDFDEFLERRF